ncbi:hypothetical protein DL93DRAFT_2091706 [Clavulina sp. PMI_390]|nr:hypothetical protein DL93DRAFT_2091706 [Clavulina sp. PMI_390]
MVSFHLVSLSFFFSQATTYFGLAALSIINIDTLVANISRFSHSMLHLPIRHSSTSAS